jgi:hypothetical protein
MVPFPHVAVERSQLDGIVKCSPATIQLLASLLETFGPLAEHPGLMQPHSIDSIGHYLDELNPDGCRERLATAFGVQATYSVSAYDLLTCETADKLPTAQRRQCTAVRGTNEMARRLEPHERGCVEIKLSFSSGGTLVVRKHHEAGRVILLLTSVNKKRKALEATLPPNDAPMLATLFEEAARGQRQAAFVPRVSTRLVELPTGSYWWLPAWYAEAMALLAQDIFRMHAFVSAISPNVSRALYVDRATAHRLERGDVYQHRTLIKGVLHRASGACACHLHRDAVTADKFQHLEFRIEFCGCALANGKCPTHSKEEQPWQSTRFPGICLLGLKLELRCAHAEGKAGLRVPLDVRNEKMQLAFAKEIVHDIASCGAHLIRPSPSCSELRIDMDASLARLTDLRLEHSHMTEQILQRDVLAVDLLRRGGVLNRAGRFAGSVRAECQAILKTHKHLFRVKSS